MDKKIEEVKRLLEKAKHYGLIGVEVWKLYPLEQLAREYNGIGPAFFPQSIRSIIDALHPDLLCCAFGHDIDWSHSDGSRATFTASNNRLMENCFIVAEKKYAWWDLRRYIRRRQGKLFRNACQIFGYGAYQAAYREQQKKGK